MASCSYCNTTILYGRKHNGDLRFCDEKCAKGALAVFANQLSPTDVASYVSRVHQGGCPKCSGPEPVDVHMSYRVWSALVMPSWASGPLVGCKSCCTKQMLGDTAFSLLLGWWGFLRGVLMTPVQLGRSAIASLKVADPNSPSPALERSSGFITRPLESQRVSAKHLAPSRSIDSEVRRRVLNALCTRPCLTVRSTQTPLLCSAVGYFGV